MNQMLAIATGGAAGALLRYWTSTGIYGLLGRGFPYGTLVVNVLGSLVMGFLYVWLIDRLVVGPAMRAFLLIGFLCSYTTFSTFSLETLNLFDSGQAGKAMVYVLSSVVICLCATWLGVLAARQL